MPASAGPAVELWQLVAGQWRFLPVMLSSGSVSSSTARAVALDYAAVEAAARMAGIAVTPDIFGDLRAIEAGAVAAFSSAAEGAP